MELKNFRRLMDVWPVIEEKYPGIRFSNYRGAKNTQRFGTDILMAVIAVLVPCRANSFLLYEGRTGEGADNILCVLKSDSIFPSGCKRNGHIETYAGGDTHVYQKDGCSYVINDGENCAIWARIASAIPMLFPKLFQEKPLTKEETRWLSLLSNLYSDGFPGKSIDEFEALCDHFYKALEVEAWRMKKVVHSLCSGDSEKKIIAAKKDITSWNEEIESAQCRIDYLINQIKEKELLLLALLNGGEDQAENELVDFLSHSNIRIDTAENEVFFTVFTLFGCYDEGEVKPYVLQNNRVLAGDAGGWNGVEVPIPYSKKQMRQFYQAVFDHRFHIKLAARYSIKSNLEVTAQRSRNIIDTDYINNPNIGNAGCLGGYAGDLAEARRSGDAIAVFSICQQSASNINLGEIWPMATVTQCLAASTGKVIRTVNGDITFKEAMEMILNEEEKA